MATVTSALTFPVLIGSPVTATAGVVIVDSESAGVLGALRILTHPDTSNFPPLTYWGNPLRTTNLDNDVLYVPDVSTVETLGTTQVLRYERAIDDVIVSESWPGSDNQLSMPSSFFRNLYELLINQPDVGEYITWQPRDRNLNTYNVAILDLTVGGKTAELDVIDFKPAGGLAAGGSIPLPGETTEPVVTGYVDREVVLKMKIISKV
jgi:hypothetical protein